MRKTIIVSLLSAFLFCRGNLAFSQELSARDDQPQLKDILKHTAEYCEKLKKIALDFVCLEKIEEKIHAYKRVDTVSISEISSATRFVHAGLKLKNTKTKTYVYDFQMIKKGDKQEERRILLKEGRKEKHVENAELKIKGFKAQFLVYGPIGFLSRYWQQHFNYEIIGPDELNGKKAIVISASPTEEREDNYNFGKIWVDDNDFSILKIEWDARYIKGFEERVSSGGSGIKRSLSWSVFYELEKNGIRFPSGQLIKETLITEGGREHPGYTATFVYDNYKFFTVETEVKYE